MTVDEILSTLIAYVPTDYDTSTGSFFNDILKPVAVEMYTLETDIAELENNCFAQTASGDYLDRKAAEQGLERKSGAYAKGTVTITGKKGEVVYEGAKIAADNVMFAVDTAATIPDTGTVDVGATCTTVGAIGNVAAGKINRFPVTLRNITAVTNKKAFSGGYDEEDDEELRERYFEKVSRPNASGNKNDYIRWAKEISGVGAAQVIPLWDGNGTVKVVITADGNTAATDDLIAEVKANIENNRPIGASVTVVSADELEINIAVSATLTGKRADLETAIKEYLANTAIDKKYVSYAKIGECILKYADDYADLKINGGTVNITVSDNEVPVLGTLTINGESGESNTEVTAE